MDALSDVLHAGFTDPWCLGVTVDAGSCAPFLSESSDIIPCHYVIEGSLRVNNRQAWRA